MEIMLETNKSESICGGIICFFQSPTFFRENLKKRIEITKEVCYNSNDFKFSC